MEHPARATALTRRSARAARSLRQRQAVPKRPAIDVFRAAWSLGGLDLGR
jgi:hypothetical protein